MQEQGSMPGQTTPVISPSVSSPAQDIQRDYAYYKAVFAGQPMPFAYLDLDLLARNIGDILKRAQGKKIRLASKSLRSVWVLRHLLAAAPTFQGIMSFSAREAAYLASQGFDDLLIGYPCWHEEDIAAIARPTANGKTITLMIDSIEHVAQLEKVAQRFDVRLPLCLDIDMALQVPGLHFGTWRSPVKTPSSARRIIERILASKYVYLDGLMGYEAQIAGVGDNVPGQAAKNALIQQLKRRSVKEVAERRLALVELIRSYGISLRFVNGGGTGSLSSTSQEEVVTEITVGSGFYSPTLFDLYREFRYQSAPDTPSKSCAPLPRIFIPAWAAVTSPLVQPERRSFRSPTCRKARSLTRSKALARCRRPFIITALSRFISATRSSCATARRANSASASHTCCSSRMAQSSIKFPPIAVMVNALFELQERMSCFYRWDLPEDTRKGRLPVPPFAHRKGRQI